MQLVGFGMWGTLFAALQYGLGKSFGVLDDAEISQVQQVSRSFLATILLLRLPLQYPPDSAPTSKFILS
jgi:hypothetical protein